MRYTDYKREVLNLKKTISRLEDELSNILKDCPHKEVERKEAYHRGGYDYCASTTYWDQCKLCHKTFNRKVEEYYGQFG